MECILYTCRVGVVCEAVLGCALATVYILLISFCVNVLFTGVSSMSKFRLELPDSRLEKEAIYSFVVKTELRRPVTASREALSKYYEIAIAFLRHAYSKPVEEIDGLDNDLVLVYFAGSKIFLWIHRVYTCSIALFRRVIQYIIRLVKGVER